jgi:hypothetical protein
MNSKPNRSVKPAISARSSTVPSCHSIDTRGQAITPPTSSGRASQ